jgi:hypothetical protein
MQVKLGSDVDTFKYCVKHVLYYKFWYKYLCFCLI